MGFSLRMQLSNLASAAGLTMTNHTRYAVPWQPIWPSITAEANATVRSASMKVYSSGCRPVLPCSRSQHAAAVWLPDMPIMHEKRSALRCCSPACNSVVAPSLDYAQGGSPDLTCWQDALAFASHSDHNALLSALASASETAPCSSGVLRVQIIRRSTLSYTWSSEASTSCTGYRSDVTNVLEPFKVLQNLSFPEQRLDIMHLSGTHVLSQPVLDTVTNRTGEHGMVPSH